MGKRTTEDKARADRDEGSDMEDVPIEFDYCDIQSDDFDTLKRMNQQTFDVDNTLFDLSSIAKIVLAQKAIVGIGSTIRADGAAETDGESTRTRTDDSFAVAYASVVNLAQWADQGVVGRLRDYVVSRASSAGSCAISKSGDELATTVERLFSAGSDASVGVVLSDRMINLPMQLMGDLYHFLSTEIVDAGNGKSSKAKQDTGEFGTKTGRWDPAWYRFSHVVVISRAYTLHHSDLDGDDGMVIDHESSSTKRKKNKDGACCGGHGTSGKKEMFYFHPEDEMMRQFALAAADYEFQNPRDEGAIDAKRAFMNEATRSRGFMMVFEIERFRQAYRAVFDGCIRGLGQ